MPTPFIVGLAVWAVIAALLLLLRLRSNRAIKVSIQRGSDAEPLSLSYLVKLLSVLLAVSLAVSAVVWAL